MTRRAFWIGGWAALVLGALVALVAAAVVVIGALALAGRVTYPVDISVGPFSLHDHLSTPVAARMDVCQQANVVDQQAPSDCLRFFMHGDHGGDGPVHVQDADVRPTSVSLTGTVDLATTGGWSTLVAASIARKAIGLMVISTVLLLLWRLLANSAAGDFFSARAVRRVRGIGWLLIAGSVVNTALGLVVSSSGGYEIVQFGAGPYLQRMGEAGIRPAQLALGALILLLAEMFRHGAAVEAERRLTV
jgi:hypothetical protein